MRVSLFHNPTAGDGEHIREQLLSLVRETGWEPTYYSTHELDRADLELGEHIVIAGGDGSVRKVIARFAGRGVPFAILPVGTANNIASSLGIAGEPREIVAGWEGAKLRRFDVGTAHGPWGTEAVLESVGVGLVARAMSLTDAIDKRSGWQFERKEDGLYRSVCTMAALAAELTPFEATVRLDGAEKHGRYLMVQAMNIDRIGPGMVLAPSADSGDGAFEVIVVEEDERDLLHDWLMDLAPGRRPAAPMHLRPTRRMEVEFVAADAHVDDHPAGETKAAQGGATRIEAICRSSSVEIRVAGR